MSITTTYKCDKCGAEQKDANQFWEIGVFARLVNPTFPSNLETRATPKHGMEICRKCLEGFGVHVTKQTEQSPTYNPPTLEELIRELVREEIQQG